MAILNIIKNSPKKMQLKAHTVFDFAEAGEMQQ